MDDQAELYQVQWALFVSDTAADTRISYSDVPWPGASMSAKDIVEVVLHGTKVKSSFFLMHAAGLSCNGIERRMPYRIHIQGDLR